MLVHLITFQHFAWFPRQFAGTYLYSRAEGGTVIVECLSFPRTKHDYPSQGEKPDCSRMHPTCKLLAQHNYCKMISEFHDPKGVLRISGDVDDQRIFLGLKF